MSPQSRAIEVHLERRFDHVFEFRRDGYESRKMYVRRTIAGVPQWGNVGSCLFLPFVCLALSGVDEASGGQFNLVPNPLHAELHPMGETGTEVDQENSDTNVVIFNASPGTLTFSLDHGSECELKKGQYAVRALPRGPHEVEAFHWDMFKMTGKTPLEIDASQMFIAVYATVYSTRAAFANELPDEFTETCVEAEAGEQAANANTVGPLP